MGIHLHRIKIRPDSKLPMTFRRQLHNRRLLLTTHPQSPRITVEPTLSTSQLDNVSVFTRSIDRG
ncbi:hypothetical protein CPB83DRAFT_847663 [Crepidotus variabilis]|uniref:Uncharacterized protein n=1 Tax=Crepidotus variabilis TaxID=179855 RepID=A0A9P6EPI1_9AGAR|nr:hypothetical protein CPB83DRAFT_847663 [Crepidotus variabilis]